MMTEPPTTPAEFKAMGLPVPSQVWRFDETKRTTVDLVGLLPARFSPLPCNDFSNPKTYYLMVIKTDRFGCWRVIQAAQSRDGRVRFYLDGKRITRKKLRRRWGLKVQIAPVLHIGLRRKLCHASDEI